MYYLTGLIFLSIFGIVLARQGSPSDIIWFPIEDIKNGFASSLGEVYITPEPNNWDYLNIDGKGRRRFRSVNDESRLNGFHSERRGTEERIVFPDSVIRSRQENIEDCLRLCPYTPEYNPICGTDFTNYKNMGILKCSQLCGKDVQFAHFGVCGSGLPLIFKPRPRPPRAGDVNRG